ncbi:hypothetical protein HYPSUDRAFT_210068 [Hypholoma sublateritium FD-334 SS-4]|uniref:Uncharacterized protein n=1 Tax=Hypholoma sublateritium (strain FD-334 SS-4) TaxID=945553 RepID=A0A0D2NWB0_HYPSF|nr:hypothetical protein HYPSUDRAFT_210068 [Hypholoma sublateritium FD-334 SS-4]
MTGYQPMRFDFLHVRWFQLDPARARGSALRLDRVSFPPIVGKDAFSFLDPSIVLRGCHLIPAYSLGRRNLQGIQLSELSKDKNDWRGYYVNRFADRDMVMRYHWGLGIGHTYSHGVVAGFQQHPIPPSVDEPEEADDVGDGPPALHDAELNDEDEGSDDAVSASDTAEGHESDDEAFLELHDTYYSD